MISLKKRNQAFTIVELLIVIVVIGILALLVITTYSGIKKTEHNDERKADIGHIAQSLEAYYSANGYYPSLANMNSNTWVAANLKGLDEGDLVDPSNADHKAFFVTSPTAKSYAYAVTDDAGNSCESDATTCAKYTLTATYEGSVNGTTTLIKSSFN
jgi:prepilin-type N-terminal cleavage/methylation domain-containing protein